MSAAKTQNQTNKETKDNNILVLYRLDAVESALKDLSSKVDRQDNIKKADLMELRDTIVDRITEIRTDLQKQIDEKADRQELSDFKKVVTGIGTFVSALSLALFSYLLTRLK